MKGITMHLVQDQNAKVQGELHGLAGWLVGLVKGSSLFTKARNRGERKHMRVVESLPMGPKRHLYLVSCDGERFLVGGGLDSVQSIVRVRPETTSLGLVRGGEDAR